MTLLAARRLMGFIFFFFFRRRSFPSYLFASDFLKESESGSSASLFVALWATMSRSGMDFPDDVVLIGSLCLQAGGGGMTMVIAPASETSQNSQKSQSPNLSAILFYSFGNPANIYF